jgi:hypothetical protein
MATSIKISQLPAKGANLEATDLLEVSEFNGTGYVSKSITGAEIVGGVGSGFVPTTRTLTINGTTQDLSANRTFTISTGITIGTTAITSGTVGRVLFEGTGNVVQESANLFWDNTNNRLGIGSSSPSGLVHLFASANTVLLNFARASNNATKAGWFQVDASDNVVYTSTNGALDFKTNWNGGTQLSTMYLNSNGTVGIGTSTLTTGTPLTIQGASNNGLTIRGNSTSDRYKQFIGNGTTYTADEIFLQAINTNLNILGGATGTTNWLTIKSTGNVLINTTTDAGFKLDVNGTVRSRGNLYFGASGSYLFGDTNNIRLYDKNNIIVLQSFPNGVSASETYLRTSSGNGAFLRLRDDYINLEWANSTMSSTVQNPINITRGYFGNVGATDKSVLYVKSNSFSNLSNATTLRGIFIDINDTTTFTGFTTTRAIEAPRGGAYFNTTSVNASAVLQADSTTQGFLPPRMTTTQKNAIASPATGLMVYDTTLNLISVFNGTIWI